MNPPPNHHARVPLVFLPPGSDGTVAEIGNGIDSVQREQLAAYGLVAGCTLKVLQQRPMSVILVDELELALEAAVARDIWTVPIRRIPSPKTA